MSSSSSGSSRKNSKDSDADKQDRIERKPPPAGQPRRTVPAPKSHFKSQEDQELIRLALHKSPFFTCLDEEQIERFVRTARKETFKPGSIVILEGCIDEEISSTIDKQNIISKPIEYVKEPEDTTIEQSTIQDEVSLAENELTATGSDDESSDYIVPNVDPLHDNRRNKQGWRWRGDTMDSTNSTDMHHSSEVSTDSMQNTAPVSDAKEEEENKAKEEEKDKTTEEEEEDDDDAVATTLSTDSNTPPLTPPLVTRNSSVHYVPAPRSGKVRSLYIIRQGKADVWYQQNSAQPPPVGSKTATAGRHNFQRATVQYHSRPNYISPYAMGPGKLFGEGGFLFGRQHSASIVASRNANEDLECWVVDLPTFRDYVLLSDNMKNIFRQFASVKDDLDWGEKEQQREEDDYDDERNLYMTLDDFMRSCEHDQIESTDLLAATIPKSSAAAAPQIDPWARARVANTLQLLKPTATDTSTSIMMPTNNMSGRGHPYQRISLSDFCWFYFLLARPDPEVDIAFLLMDQTQSGQVGLAQVAALVEPVFPETDYESDFFRRYFGEDGQKTLRPTHFNQFFADLHQELGRQVFVRAAAPTNGYLEPAEFVNVLRTALGWRLPLSVIDRLESLYCRGPFEAGEAAARVSMQTGSLYQETTAATAERAKVSVMAEMEQTEKGLGDRCFAYPDFLAFQEVITNLPGICNLIDRAQEIKKDSLSPDDMKVANRVLGMGGRLSRRQVDILFALFDLDKDGYISHEDTISVCGVDFARRLVAVEGRNGKLTFAPPPEYRPRASASKDNLGLQRKDLTTVEQIVAVLEYFALTAIAGALGTIVLYPVDLVKTRLMNQQMERNGTRMYRGFLDCLRRAIAAEGFSGLYRGLTPQLLGVAPEKIIKLQVNDLLRKAFSSKDEETGKPVNNLALETMAGAVSGASQLLITNPMELTKIRMQLQGETSRVLAERGWATIKPQTFVEVVRGLGFPGIYRGASSCLLRDVFFGALYFPTYAWCKDQLAARNEIPGYATPFDLLAAGTIAGIPAALLTTPFDVIKTRLQSLPRPGETTYINIRQCARTIYKQEGFGGFFLGAGPRVFRIAPQFGITLLTYEMLTGVTGSRQSTPAPPTNAFVEPYDYRTAFPVRSIQTKTTEISNFMQAFGLGSGKDDKK